MDEQGGAAVPIALETGQYFVKLLLVVNFHPKLPFHIDVGIFYSDINVMSMLEEKERCIKNSRREIITEMRQKPKIVR